MFAADPLPPASEAEYRFRRIALQAKLLLLDVTHFRAAESQSLVLIAHPDWCVFLRRPFRVGWRVLRKNDGGRYAVVVAGYLGFTVRLA